jgi:hypothetical protein
VQLIVVSNPVSATLTTSLGLPFAVGSSGLGTISVGATLPAAMSLLQSLPTGVRFLAWSGTTNERNAVWPNGPAFGVRPALGTLFNDSSLGVIVSYTGEPTSATGWSSLTATGV